MQLYTLLIAILLTILHPASSHPLRPRLHHLHHAAAGPVHSNHLPARPAAANLLQMHSFSINKDAGTDAPNGSLEQGNVPAGLIDDDVTAAPEET